MKLLCIAPYRNDARGLVFMPGRIIEGDEALIRYLLVDAPGCFSTDTTKAATPAEDKAIKRAPANKGQL